MTTISDPMSLENPQLAAPAREDREALISEVKAVAQVIDPEAFEERERYFEKAEMWRGRTTDPNWSQQTSDFMVRTALENGEKAIAPALAKARTIIAMAPPAGAVDAHAERAREHAARRIASRIDPVHVPFLAPLLPEEIGTLQFETYSIARAEIDRLAVDASQAAEVERLRHENDCLQARIAQLDYPCSPHCDGYLRELKLRRDFLTDAALRAKVCGHLALTADAGQLAEVERAGELLAITDKLVHTLALARRPHGYVITTVLPLDQLLETYLRARPTPPADASRSVEVKRVGLGVPLQAEGFDAVAEAPGLGWKISPEARDKIEVLVRENVNNAAALHGIILATLPTPPAAETPAR